MANVWEFTASFDRERRNRLMAVVTFEEVIEMITRTMHVVGGWICPATDLGPNDSLRPVVALTVAKDAFDAFFNGRSGYRGKFLEGPEVGQAANGWLLRTLEPHLSSAVLADCGSERMSREWIRNSFLANSAKVWPDESELDFTTATSDIAIEHWNGESDVGSVLPSFASWAPEGSELLAIGAFIDPWGNELVPRRKILRRFELHDHRFT